VHRTLSESNNPSSSECQSFEQALTALEQIVHDLEDGRLGLAESLARYEQGVKLLKRCFTQLEQAERRIEMVTGVDAAGNPTVLPFDVEATSTADQDRPTRSRRADESGNDSEAFPRAIARDEPRAMDEPGSLF